MSRFNLTEDEVFSLQSIGDEKLIARLEFAYRDVKDCESNLARNILVPRIYPIYADCRWGIGLSRDDWAAGAQGYCRKVVELLDSAQREEVVGLADLHDLRDDAMAEGIIELGEYENGEVRPLVDAVKAKDALEKHIQTLAVMQRRIGETSSKLLANLRVLLRVAELDLKSALELLG
jgi:hypothetical protein